MNGHALFFFVRCGEGKEKFVNLPLDRACAEMGGKSARHEPFPSQQHQDNAIHDACECAKDNDRACDHEHL